MDPSGPGNGEPLAPVPALPPSVPTSPRLVVHREAISRLQEVPLPDEDDPAPHRRRKIRDQPPQVRRKRT